MHEIGLCEAILDSVKKRADGRRVRRVRVRIGALRHVVQGSLEQGFEMVAAGTVADGAAIEMVTLPVQVDCRSCGRHIESDEMVLTCPQCEGTDLDLVGGNELLLESLELAAPAADSGARPA